jgi:hypothetical protein
MSIVSCQKERKHALWSAASVRAMRLRTLHVSCLPPRLLAPLPLARFRSSPHALRRSPPPSSSHCLPRVFPLSWPIGISRSSARSYGHTSTSGPLWAEPAPRASHGHGKGLEHPPGSSIPGTGVRNTQLMQTFISFSTFVDFLGLTWTSTR